MGRRLLFAMAAVLCIAAVVAIATVLTVDSDDTGSRAGGTAFAVLLFGLAAAGGVAAIDRAWIGWACLAVAAAGLVVALVLIWASDDWSEASGGLSKAFGSLLFGALALAQISVLARHAEEQPHRAPVYGAQVAALLLAGLLIGAILTGTESETYYRWLGVGWALWLLATALVPLARRLLARSWKH